MLDKQILTQDLQKRPLISFIVTTYNLQPELLAECLDSIMALSLSDQEREVILVDDGSDIPAIMQLTDYQNNIIYIRQPNCGLSEARNAGIRIATGKYIQFVDGDDKLLPTPYEHCVDIARYNDPDVVMFNFTHKLAADVPFEFDEPTTGVEYMNNNNLKASACTYFFRKEILGSLSFTPGRICEDEEFTPQLMIRAQKVFKTNSNAYFYRVRKGSITNNQDSRKIVTRLNNVFDILCNLLQLSTRVPEDARQALQRRIAQLSMDYLYNTATMTHSMHQLEEAINKLYDKGLYPLPDKSYTIKYKTFRKLISNKAGRYLLILKGLRG